MSSKLIELQRFRRIYKGICESTMTPCKNFCVGGAMFLHQVVGHTYGIPFLHPSEGFEGTSESRGK